MVFEARLSKGGVDVSPSIRGVLVVKVSLQSMEMPERERERETERGIERERERDLPPPCSSLCHPVSRFA